MQDPPFEGGRLSQDPQEEEDRRVVQERVRQQERNDWGQPGSPSVRGADMDEPPANSSAEQARKH